MRRRASASRSSDREIDQELETIINDQFGGQKQFDRFLEQSAFSDEDARERVRLQLLSQRIQEDIVGTEPPDIPDEEVENFYNENIEQFQTPETRDVRTILTQDEADAQEAYDQLSEDDSPASWKQVAKEFSTDEATADLGGLRQGVAEGQSEPQLDEAIFSAPEGELVGPIQTDAGFYVLQVDAINEASTQPLDEQTQRADRADPRQPAAAGDRRGVPDRLPREVAGADGLQRGLRDRPLQQRSGTARRLPGRR